MGKRKGENPPLIIYPEWEAFFLGLKNEDAGYMIKSIFLKLKGQSLETWESIQTLDVMVDFMVNKILNNQREYVETCEKRRASVNSRYHGKDYNCTQMNTNVDTNLQNDTSVTPSMQKNYKTNPKTKTKPNPKPKTNISSSEDISGASGLIDDIFEDN